MLRTLDRRVCKLWTKELLFQSEPRRNCKVRGFSLNYKSSLILNFESMKEALVAWKRNEKKELVTVKTELVRDKYKPKVFNRVISKHYGVVYDKRKVLPDFTSIPFGFRY